MKSMDDWLTQPAGLATKLRDLRKAANLTGAQLATRIGDGWTQSKVSKLETGKQLPTDDELTAWCTACGNTLPLPALRALLAEALGMHREFRQQMRLGQAPIQRGYDELVRGALVVRNFEVTAIPGLLQVPGYARARIADNVRLYGADPAEAEAAIAARLARQQVLADPSRRFEFVITEACLRLLTCPPDAMLAQLVRLLELTTGAPEHVTFGVIPFGEYLDVIPQNAFLLLDDELAIAESFTGEMTLHGDEAAVYVSAMDAMVRQSVTGPAARALVLDAIDFIRARQT